MKISESWLYIIPSIIIVIYSFGGCIAIHTENKPAEYYKKAYEKSYCAEAAKWTKAKIDKKFCK